MPGGAFDYTKRVAVKPEVDELAAKKQAAVANLSRLLAQKDIEIKAGLHDTEGVSAAIARLEALHKIEAEPGQKAVYQAKAEKLRSLEQERKDIEAQVNKIKSLSPVQIPDGNGGFSPYYSVADSAGGVTLKTCLVSKGALEGALDKLAVAGTIKQVRADKVRMNAIIKHPKKGEITEVQREAIGLEFARKLGFGQVSDSTFIKFETAPGVMEPCLFVPFGEMEELTDSIENAASMHGRLNRGLNHQVEDFGKYAAFFMMCSDTDFIGKNGQNKGLAAGTDGKRHLYIFDQVFMTSNNLGFDHALNLIPTTALAKFPLTARHFMGRNKSVINDSSYSEKIDGVLDLLSKKEPIEAMFTAAEHANAGSSDKEAKKLRADAKDCHKQFTKRLTHLTKILPKVMDAEGKQVSPYKLVTNDDQKQILKQSMLLNQLLNKPKLFDKTGKPYRAPVFDQLHTRVKSLKIIGDQVEINFTRSGFGKALSANKKKILEAQGFTVNDSGKATISQADLLALSEAKVYPVLSDTIAEDTTYLDEEQVKFLSEAYKQTMFSTKGLDVICAGVKELQHRDSAQYMHNLHILIAIINKNDPKGQNAGFSAHLKSKLIHDFTRVLIEENPAREKELMEGLAKFKRGEVPAGEEITFLREQHAKTFPRHEVGAAATLSAELREDAANDLTAEQEETAGPRLGA